MDTPKSFRELNVPTRKSETSKKNALRALALVA
jgi:hypothetical protein